MAQPEQMQETHESNQTLWLLAAAPAIWAGHFLLSYITASIWCAKYAGAAGSLLSARVLIAIYTAIAIVGIGIIFLIGYRRRSHEGETGPTDKDSPEARHRFLGLATLLLAGLSAVATIYVALAAVFIATCD
jgi:heme/copper-type cytochrome/quinol oxidase subunit 2